MAKSVAQDPGFAQLQDELAPGLALPPLRFHPDLARVGHVHGVAAEI